MLIEQVVTIVDAAQDEQRIVDGRARELAQARLVRVVRHALEVEIARVREYRAAYRARASRFLHVLADLLLLGFDA